MASEFQRRKIAAVFDAMDVNGDGFLERSDFESLSARWTRIRGAVPGSDDHIRLTAIMMGWWDTLLAVSGSGQDGRVTLDEVLHLVDRLGSMPEAVTATAAAMFEAVDEDGDGAISPVEYRRLVEAWTGRATDTDEVFPLLDHNADGYLSDAEFAALWTEFWAGDNPDSPGSWVFGRFAGAGA